MGKFKLPDGSYIFSRLDAPKGQNFFVVPPSDQMMRRLKSVADDPVSRDRLRSLLADKHNVAELKDGEVLEEIDSAIQSGKLVWVGKDGGAPKSAGVGVAQKEAEPAPPPPASKQKEEVIVTPKLEIEFKVVLLHHMEKHGDPKFAPEPTWIKCSMSQSPHTPIFEKGAKLSVDGAGKVEAFEDEKFTKPWPLAKAIPNDKLVSSGGFQLWLKGTKKGLFTLKLEVDSPSGVFKADKPAEEKMGVVELHMVLHDEDLDGIKKLQVNPDEDPYTTYHDNLKKLKIPDQKALSDADKAKKGRILHVQKDVDHGRAKLILKKLDDAEWPDGTDKYQIVLTSSETADAAKVNAAAAAFDKEMEGVSKDKVLVSALLGKKANDVTIWVEGKTASKKALDTRIDLGVSDGKVTKRNGDWARLTIVQIKEVKLEVSKDGGKPVVWDSAKKRFYVNTMKDNDGRKLSDHAGGNRIKVSAVLTEQIKDISIHFMLAGHKDNWNPAKWTKDNKDKPNFKYGKVVAAVKVIDKKDRKDLLHLSFDTDAKGVAVMKDLVLSRLAGEKYQIGAYITQDAHLAKYLDGHPDLSKRKPVLGGELNVFRKIWVQLSYPKTAAVVARAQVKTAFSDAAIEYEEIDEKQYDKASIAGLVEYEEWQFVAGGGTKKVLCVGSHNQPQFEGLFQAPTADHNPKAHMILCEHQWDPQPSKEMSWETDKRVSKHNAQDDEDKYIGIFDPPLDGGSLFDSGAWEWEQVVKTVTMKAGKKVTKTKKTLHNGDVLEDMVKIEKSRGHTSEFKVTLPAACGVSCAGCGGGTVIAVSGSAKAKVTVKLNGGSGPWEGSSGTPHCQIVISSDVANFNNTILHEIGHQFNQVRGLKNWLGVPNHHDWYEKRGGQGPHCKWKASLGKEKDEDGKKVYIDGKCIMFSGCDSVVWCDNCKSDLRVRNLFDFGLDD